MTNILQNNRTPKNSIIRRKKAAEDLNNTDADASKNAGISQQNSIANLNLLTQGHQSSDP